MNKMDIIIEKLDAIMECMLSHRITPLSSSGVPYNKSEIRARIKTGVWLNIVKRDTPHGDFQELARSQGVPERLRRRSLRIARAFMAARKLGWPTLQSFELWATCQKTERELNTFIGDCASWKAILEKHHIPM